MKKNRILTLKVSQTFELLSFLKRNEIFEMKLEFFLKKQDFCFETEFFKIKQDFYFEARFL